MGKRTLRAPLSCRKNQLLVRPGLHTSFYSADLYSNCIISYRQEWKEDKEAHKARLWADVKGHENPQLGRVAWMATAQPYPDLEACKQLLHVPMHNEKLPSPLKEVAKRPLEGFTVLDFADVIAGPSCGRMFAELGATVIKVDPTNPFHPPEIMLTWQGETCAGKESVIFDAKSPEGQKILQKLVPKADIVMANKLHAQWERLGLDIDAVKGLNPNVIVLEVAAHNGEKKEQARNDYFGYDPELQASNGFMRRLSHGLLGHMVRRHSSRCPPSTQGWKGRLG